MKKLVAIVCVLAIISTIFLYSCKREQDFSVVPLISFVEFKKYGFDSATCRINFTDGDGDIGLDPFDTIAPFNLHSHYNSDLFLVYYYLDTISKSWKVYNQHQSDTVKKDFDTLQYTYRIPNLTQNGQKQSLQGEIKVAIPGPYGIPGQTFKYEITLVDRALHVSNMVQTGNLTFP
jgi:hypothetical protein